MIPFKKKNAREILDRFVQDAQKYNLLSDNIDYYSLIMENKDIESVFVLLLNVWASSIEDVYTDMEDVKDGYNVLTATGIDLDNLGVLKGISRPGATFCSTNLKFTLAQPLTEILTVNFPITVSTDNGILYTTAEEITLAVDTTEFTLLAYADLMGSDQRVAADTLTILKTTLPDILGVAHVTNPESATGGSEIATDDEYREYLINADKIHEKGTRWAFVNYLNRYDGLDSYNLVPQWDGTGTVKVIIDVADNTAYHINKITEGIQEEVLRCDDDVLVVAPETVELKISIDCNVDIDRLNPYSSTEKEQIKSRILTSIRVYVNGGARNNGAYYKGLCIGDDFIPHKLAVFLDNEISELKNIIINNPTNPVTVNEEQIAHIEDENIEITME
jgi:uncharacterized phage protein gp47/JayE